MAAEVTIVVIPSDTEAGSFNIYQFIYDSNGDPQPDPFLLESNVPESSFIAGYTVIVDDNAYGVRLVSNNDRGFGCVNAPIDHFFSNIQISNNFTIPQGNISVTGVTFGSTLLSPLPDLNSTVLISLNTGTTVQDTTTVGIYNNEAINTLSYQITLRDSDNILPFTYSDTISPASGAEVSFTGTTLSPDRQFRVLLNSFVQPSPTPTQSVSPTIPATPSVTPSTPASPSVTPTVTSSPGLSPSLTPSFTPSRTLTPTPTPSISVSTSPGLSPSITPTLTPTRTLSKTITPSVTISPSFTPSKTPTHSPTPTPSMPAWETVVITNTNGAFNIIDVTVNSVPGSVYDLSIPFPIQPGQQSVGITNQRGLYTVSVFLSAISTGEHIQVDAICTSTTGQNILSFPSTQTIGGVNITYGDAIC